MASASFTPTFFEGKRGWSYGNPNGVVEDKKAVSFSKDPPPCGEKSLDFKLSYEMQLAIIYECLVCTRRGNHEKCKGCGSACLRNPLRTQEEKGVAEKFQIRCVQ
ncbi:MAG TPA: hypothetical protein P5230_01760 [Candidatus Magasanikbacteria bacterium]|nr:hypothetical protein [Candidatus Magasanikbacteria bacterium]